MIDIIEILLTTFVSVFCSFPFFFVFAFHFFLPSLVLIEPFIYQVSPRLLSASFLSFFPPLSSRRRNTADDWLGHLLYSLRFMGTNKEVVPRDSYFLSSVTGGRSCHQVGMLWSKTQSEPWIKIDKVGLLYFVDSCLWYPCLTHQYETRIPM